MSPQHSSDSSRDSFLHVSLLKHAVLEPNQPAVIRHVLGGNAACWLRESAFCRLSIVCLRGYYAARRSVRWGPRIKAPICG